MIKTLFSLFLSLLMIGSSHAGLFSSKPKFLKAEEAFVFSLENRNENLLLNWDIAEDYYLYKKEIKITPQNIELGDIKFPAAEQYNDEFFGQVEIYRNELQLAVPFKEVKDNAAIEVVYQGCTKGFCYPPERLELKFDSILTANPEELAEQAVENSENFAKSEQDKLADKLSNNRFSIFWFFVLGLGLAFTPCVLPMLPLLSAIVIGNKERPSTAKALLLSLAYVQGMALTYTLLGLIVAAIGLPFQVALQSPPVLISLSIVFILLACSMFGLYEIKLPNSWQQKLNAMSQKQQGGAFGSVFVMGMIAGLIASPCTSAPLSGALLYVAQSGDLLTGGLALYLLALGMGLPLILITLFGNKILPKSGEWLLKVKTAFGFVMLALPVFLLSRVLPSHYEPFLWSALAVAFLIWLLETIPSHSIIKKIIKIFLLIALAFAAKPWTDLVWNGSQIEKQNTQHLTLEQIRSLADLEAKLTASKGKKVMLDLYADWCVACKEFEKYTFTDTNVQQKLNEMVVLQIDLTKNSTENIAFMQHFNVLGLPTILFFDENGNELSQSRVTGFLEANQFLDRLNKL
ncbi:Thiol:disulfide interchange protein DsbD [Mannheimia sp. USDA-ARS-USMARC-1261]|uniref:protein-disulfide reductase DsbD n=1 Tax=Mannheimia sp. USDA-ARS-USMARC-1261 TaxID=1432056 RepID=UPI0003E3C840|nr:protein-disulfide reductase DsbD [Mannheimia sp. USDA-ARS-USMARC-1261]AHG72729.1 Thiol:disulfide interchange protein DsbD [Mannheimia sp. USDA-ARS-USMARC-1261]